MTTQQYWIRINTVSIKTNRIAELEKIISKISAVKEQEQFQILAIFKNLNDNEISINYEIISKIEKKLKLIFIEEEIETNICFANSDELRFEYKQSFKLIDLLDYIYAFVHLSIYKQSSAISIVPEIDIFWKMIQIGAELRKKA